MSNFQFEHPADQIVYFMKRIYDRRILEAGIRLYYGVKAVETEVEERRIGALIVSTPRGLRKIEGELFLDCTGDAAVAALAGVPFHKGDENGDTMAPTLCVQFSNVDIAAYRASIAENGNDLDIWHRLLKAGKAPLDEHHFVGVCTYGNGSASGNLGHIYGVDTLNEEDLTRCYVRGREIAELYHRFYREHVPGFAKCDLVQTAPLLGVRESRRPIPRRSVAWRRTFKRPATGPGKTMASLIGLWFRAASIICLWRGGASAPTGRCSLRSASSPAAC